MGTRFWLAADGERAAGMILQQLPAQLVTDSAERDAHWEHAATLASTLGDDELMSCAAPEIAHRLYHEDPLRLFEPLQVAFRCSCSRERTLNALASLPRSEVEELLEELGSIIMDCEFCNQQYRYRREDLSEILGSDGASTLH